MIRADGRRPDQLREVRIVPDAQVFAEGSVIVETGQTRVLCAISVEEGVPRFLQGAGKGWLTAEYSMLPRSTITRNPREGRGRAPRGRIQEIQRMIGRSLRAAVDMESLGERTLTVDCDVLQADGGTRTAAITGAYVALYQALVGLVNRNDLTALPLKCAVAATSVGVIDGQVMLDLSYEEDYRAESDFNVVMTDSGEFVEVQGTAEDGSFSRAVLDEVLASAERGIAELFQAQQEVVRGL